jgi:hypothetical protein
MSEMKELIETIFETCQNCGAAIGYSKVTPSAFEKQGADKIRTIQLSSIFGILILTATIRALPAGGNTLDPLSFLILTILFCFGLAALISFTWRALSIYESGGTPKSSYGDALTMVLGFNLIALSFLVVGWFLFSFGYTFGLSGPTIVDSLTALSVLIASIVTFIRSPSRQTAPLGTLLVIAISAVATWPFFKYVVVAV